MQVSVLTLCFFKGIFDLGLLLLLLLVFGLQLSKLVFEVSQLGGRLLRSLLQRLDLCVLLSDLHLQRPALLLLCLQVSLESGDDRLEMLTFLMNFALFPLKLRRLHRRHLSRADLLHVQILLQVDALFLIKFHLLLHHLDLPLQIKTRGEQIVLLV